MTPIDTIIQGSFGCELQSPITIDPRITFTGSQTLHNQNINMPIPVLAFFSTPKNLAIIQLILSFMVGTVISDILIFGLSSLFGIWVYTQRFVSKICRLKFVINNVIQNQLFCFVRAELSSSKYCMYLLVSGIQDC